MNYRQVENELYKLEKFGIKLGLERIQEILKKLDNPEKKLKCIHVAGTNGKGSVCAILSAILQRAGYKAGLYTSPHLVSVRERIKINDKLIPKQEFICMYEKVKKHYTGQTFFELLTAMAIVYFKEKEVDVAIFEVGMGGRLDATNVITPLVSIITNIGMEHEKSLGSTLSRIAYEKAGIIKRNVPVVTNAKGKALETIRKAAKNNSKVIIAKEFNYRTNIMADYQKENINTALTALDSLDSLKINEEAIKLNEEAIKQGLLNVKWPGRFQFIKKNILIDCAHNPHGFRALIKDVKKLSYNRLIILMGFSEDKDYKGIISLIRPFAYYFIITKSDVKPLDPEIIAAEIKKFSSNYKIFVDVKKGFEHGKKLIKEDDLLLITGSIYMIGKLLSKSS